MKSFLCDKTPFFKSAFTLGFREALERENMTEEDPIAFCQCKFHALFTTWNGLWIGQSSLYNDWATAGWEAGWNDLPNPATRHRSLGPLFLRWYLV
jgi:hypothetical protein